MAISSLTLRPVKGFKTKINQYLNFLHEKDFVQVVLIRSEQQLREMTAGGGGNDTEILGQNFFVCRLFTVHAASLWLTHSNISYQPLIHDNICTSGFFIMWVTTCGENICV